MRRSVQRAEGITEGCPMGGMLEMLTRPWTLHILWLLSQNGAMRFGALRRSAEGISARVLTLRLRTLEDKGLVRRTVKQTNPPEVTYAPTARLRDMNVFMGQLQLLSQKWQREDQSTESSAAAREVLDGAPTPPAPMTTTLHAESAEA